MDFLVSGELAALVSSCPLEHRPAPPGSTDGAAHPAGSDGALPGLHLREPMGERACGKAGVGQSQDKKRGMLSEP